MMIIKSNRRDDWDYNLSRHGIFSIVLLSVFYCFIIFFTALSADTRASATQAAHSGHAHGVFYAVSAAPNGANPNGSSYYSSVSAFGKYVVFVSTTNNFGTQDRWSDSDVFMKNTQDGTISLISCGGSNDIYSSGSASDPYYYMNPPAVSANGRYVAFEFDGSLGSNDTNGVYDIFLRDTWLKETIRISTSAGGAQGNKAAFGPDISADGRFVTFESSADNLIAADTNKYVDVFLKDVVTGAVTCISTNSAAVQGNSQSSQPSISADGRYVAFMSKASNLATGDANEKNDIFIKDTLTGSTSRVSTGIGSEPNGNSYYPDISADGRYVAFRSTATNLAAGDSNGTDDIFVKDMTTGVTVIASVSQNGDIANQQSNGAPEITDDGKYVTFESKASNLVEGDINGQGDIFRKDIHSGEIIMMSVGQDGSPGSTASMNPSLSPDGNFLSFTSNSNNLMPGDTDGMSDVFLASANTLGPSIAITSPPEKDWLPSDSLMIEADLIDAGYGIDEASVALQVDGLIQEGCSVYSSHFSCQVSGLTRGVHPFIITAKDLSGNTGYGYSTVNIDHLGPTIAKIIPNGEWVSLPASIWVDIRDNESGVDKSSAAFSIDGSPVTACSWDSMNAHRYHCGSNELAQGEHSFRYSVSDKVGNTSVLDGSFKVDSIPPKISNTQPQGQIDGPEYTITADLSDAGSGINASSFLLIVNGAVVKNGVTVTNNKLTYHGSGLGEQSVLLRASDIAGHNETAEWQFTATTDKISYFPWYDSKYGKTWVLMAQDSGDADGGSTNVFDVFYRPAQEQSMIQMNSGGTINVAAGQTKSLYKGGALGGPVVVKAVGAGMVSERSLFGNSFEEVWGMSYDELDSHYWWPMYDGYSAGMRNWVLVSNPPENSESIQAKVLIHIPPEYGGNEVLYSPALAPGETWTPQFQGLMGGPVEVKTWRYDGSENNPSDARKSVASQRVMYNGSFNEMPGVAASRLDDSYIWTWYDDVSPGAKNWIMMANPDPYKTIYVWIGMGGGYGGGGGGPSPEEFMAIAPYETVSLRDDELIGGPVIVFSCFDPYNLDTTGAPLVASQRLLWGPSFSEIAGTSETEVSNSTANWTWYDQKSPGVKNWVLVSNPMETPIYAEIRISGQTRWSGVIDPLYNKTPTFPGVMGGPVEVEAWVSNIDPASKQQKKDEPALVFASQRVLWNGYFNEIVGKGL